MSDDKDTRQDSGKSSLGPVLCWALASLFIAYPLSVGPAAKFYTKRGSLPKVLQQFYGPLQLLYNTSPPVRRFFDWYIEEVWQTQ